MKISTKGRYALRILADLAENSDGGFLPLREVADREDISEKYMEGIIAQLSKAGLLEGQRGKGGGYRFARDPSTITVWQVLRIVEGDMGAADCVGDSPMLCPRVGSCKTHRLWADYYDMTKKYFSSITIADLANTPEPGDDYSI